MSMRRCAAGLAALGASLTLAACGGGSNDTTSTAAAGGDSAARQAKLQEAALKFTRCMRRHGIDMPDPKAGQGGGGFTIGGPGADSTPTTRRSNAPRRPARRSSRRRGRS
jgi:hypothetical protein